MGSLYGYTSTLGETGLDEPEAPPNASLQLCTWLSRCDRVSEFIAPVPERGGGGGDGRKCPAACLPNPLAGSAVHSGPRALLLLFLSVFRGPGMEAEDSPPSKLPTSLAWSSSPFCISAEAWVASWPGLPEGDLQSGAEHRACLPRGTLRWHLIMIKSLQFARHQNGLHNL